MVGSDTGELLMRRAGVGRRFRPDDHAAANSSQPPALHLPQHWLRHGRRKHQREDGSEDGDEDHQDKDGGRGRKPKDDRSSKESDDDEDDDAGRTALHGREQALKTKAHPGSVTASGILNPPVKQKVTPGAKKERRQQQQSHDAAAAATVTTVGVPPDLTSNQGPSLSRSERLSQPRNDIDNHDNEQQEDDHSSSSNPNPSRPKRKRPKKRSRQKNLVKDHRPISERPSFGQERPLTATTLAKLGRQLRKGNNDDDGGVSSTAVAAIHPPPALLSETETQVDPIDGSAGRATELDADPTKNTTRRKKKQKYKNLA